MPKDLAFARNESLVCERGFAVSCSVRDIFSRARDPRDAAELCRLYIGSVEASLGTASARPEAAACWRASRPLRDVTDEEILSSRSVVAWVKQLFNHFFRDDLYGLLRRDDTIVLSSGSLDESIFGLPSSLKRSILAALDRDWYGYSDSRGRRATRRAIAALENARTSGGPYDEEWIAVTMGGTFAIACLADFLFGGKAPTSPVLCATPNYPPMVESIARRAVTRLVPVATGEGWTDISALIEALRADTPLVFVQTVTNPTGTRIPEQQIAHLVRAASPSTLIVLDEAHECLNIGPVSSYCAERAQRNVVRVASLSKTHSVPGMKLGWIVAHPDVVREYYEYASTTYGGPPSLFYLLIEMAARFDQWDAAGLERPSCAAHAQFEPAYGFTQEHLAAEYADYLEYRRDLEHRVSKSRDATVAALAHSPFRATTATHSVNVSFRIANCDSSYAWFRRCLAATNVSCFPSILNFDFQDDSMRLTVGRGEAEMSEGVRRIAGFARGRQ
ncbi:pyridoxal phosphate-dependent aminotransferase [Paraburkholderia domus]|uniref:pyridoxal phosphate-dependent aminotransferase n=1 Tax=Paraburkholderia domus TaxID=2793075 RepID=UPI001B8D0A15|nr:pyridoxal phosphate-dependent aminotransferase [Paraburkholderia domus]